MAQCDRERGLDVGSWVASRRACRFEPADEGAEVSLRVHLCASQAGAAKDEVGLTKSASLPVHTQSPLRQLRAVVRSIQDVAVA